MPASNKHYNQYNKNKELLHNNIFNENNDYNDWAITIIFYSAMHLVEKTLADCNSTYHCQNHKDRNSMIYKIKELKPVSSSYQTLYNASIISRYKCKNIAHQEVERALSELESIENELLKDMNKIS